MSFQNKYAKQPNVCIECKNADSWGLPDRPTCRYCSGGSRWEPLNLSSVNPNTKPNESVQIAGFDVVFEESMPPNTVKFVQPAQAQEPVKRWVWVFEDRSGDKYTAKGQVYTQAEAEESAKILGVKSVGPTDEYVVCWPVCPQAQPAREWVGLTNEEIDYQAKKDDHAVYFALGALWAEAKLKEKNS